MNPLDIAYIQLLVPLSPLGTDLRMTRGAFPPTARYPALPG